MFEPKIAIAGAEVWGTGSVVAYAGQTIGIWPVGSSVLGDFAAALNVYHVELVLEEKPGEAGRIDTEAVGGGLRVRLTNFASLGAAATLGPFSVGKYNGRDLLLSIFGMPAGTARFIAWTFIAGVPVP